MDFSHGISKALKTASLSVSVLSTALLSAPSASFAAAPSVTYVIKITNGSSMPVSPAALYVTDGGHSAAELGKLATAGFVKLCQMGDAASRIAELKMNASVNSTLQVGGPLLPGQSTSVEVTVNDPKAQSLHFEAMYGKSKDVCAVASVGSHTLVGLKSHVATNSIVHDRPVVTGYFSDAKFDGGYLGTSQCKSAKDAVSCLREISTPATSPSTIRAFNGYLSSVEMGLEEKFGADEALGIQIPPAGGIQIDVSLKH